MNQIEIDCNNYYSCMIKQLIFFSLFIYSQIFTEAQGKIDVLHYKFGITLNDNNDTIRGSAAVTIRFIQPVSSFNLDLVMAHKHGNGMIVDNIISERTSALKSFIQKDDKINILLSKKLPVNDTLTFTVYYHGVPPVGLIISKNNYGDRTFFADNWPDRAHGWIPCIDDPADKASFEFIVTAPSQYEVISNGIKTEEKKLNNETTITHWAEDIPLSTKVMVIGVAHFAVKQYQDSPKNIPVSAWVYPQDRVKGFHNYSVAPAILKFFMGYIAPYPFNKLANVQSTTVFGGMENASAIFYDERSASSSKTVESLLAHEIAHQWFGDMASEKSFAHLWLSEGFATYLTHIYIESKYGKDSMNREMQKDRKEVIDFAKYSSHSVVDSVSSLIGLLNPNSYQKGSWVLHMLHRELGDSIFHTIIRAYYEKYKGKNADTRDFEAVAEEVSKKNLDTFFNQWLYTPGIPQLHVSWKYLNNEKTISVKVDQVQNRYVYVFPLEILFKYSSGKSLVKKIYISKQSEVFDIPLTSKPEEIRLDPNTSLLFESSQEDLKN